MLLFPFVLQSYSLSRLIKNRWFDTPSGDSSIHYFLMCELERIRKGFEPKLLIGNASKPNVPSSGYSLASLFPRNFILRHSWVHFAFLYLMGCSFVFCIQIFWMNRLNPSGFDSFSLCLSFALYLAFFPDHLSVDEYRIQYKVLNQRYLNNILVSACTLSLVFLEYNHQNIQPQIHFLKIFLILFF